MPSKPSLSNEESRRRGFVPFRGCEWWRETALSGTIRRRCLFGGMDLCPQPVSLLPCGLVALLPCRLRSEICQKPLNASVAGSTEFPARVSRLASLRKKSPPWDHHQPSI